MFVFLCIPIWIFLNSCVDLSELQRCSAPSYFSVVEGLGAVILVLWFLVLCSCDVKKNSMRTYAFCM